MGRWRPSGKSTVYERSLFARSTRANWAIAKHTLVKQISRGISNSPRCDGSISILQATVSLQRVEGSAPERQFIHAGAVFAAAPRLKNRSPTLGLVVSRQRTSCAAALLRGGPELRDVGVAAQRHDAHHAVAVNRHDDLGDAVALEDRDVADFRRAHRPVEIRRFALPFNRD
jgi:hypothetical protein